MAEKLFFWEMKWLLLAGLCWLIVESALEKTVYHLNDQLEFQYGYAQAILVGSTLYISGTMPKDSSSGSGGAGLYPNAFQMETQMRKIYGDLKATLGHFGLNFYDVIEESIYTTDMASLNQAMYIRSEFISPQAKMTSTTVQIYSLLDPGGAPSGPTTTA